MEFDPFITPPEPSNPWISDNTDHWEQESTTLVESVSSSMMMHFCIYFLHVKRSIVPPLVPEF